MVEKAKEGTLKVVAPTPAANGELKRKRHRWDQTGDSAETPSQVKKKPPATNWEEVSLLYVLPLKPSKVILTEVYILFL